MRNRKLLAPVFSLICLAASLRHTTPAFAINARSPDVPAVQGGTGGILPVSLGTDAAARLTSSALALEGEVGLNPKRADPIQEPDISLGPQPIAPSAEAVLPARTFTPKSSMGDSENRGAPTHELGEILAGAISAIQNMGDISQSPPSAAHEFGDHLQELVSGGASRAAPRIGIPVLNGDAGRRSSKIFDRLRRIANKFLPKKVEKNLKIALCQIDTTVGDFDYNVRHMLRFIRKAAEAGADMAVLPELSLSGYPPRDLLEYPHFIETNEKARDALLKGISSIPEAPRTVIIGSAMRNPEPIGKPLQNAAVILHQGGIAHFQNKQLLPNEDVFDELRYFAPGARSRPWFSPWGKIGFLVCEDAWHAALHWGRRLYKTKDPAESLRGSKLAVNINASPYEWGKHDKRKAIISGAANRVSAPLVYVNQVGPQDDILFDGGSFVYSPTGELLFEMPQFKESIGIVNLKLGKRPGLISSRQWEWDAKSSAWLDLEFKPPMGEIEVLFQGLVAGIRGYFTKVGYNKAIVGFSGGIDSSVVGALAVEALGPENVVAALMPSKYSSPGSLTDAIAEAKNLGIKYVIIPIQNAVDAIGEGLQPAFGDIASIHAARRPGEDTTEDNIQARLRGVILMALANKFNFLTLNTSNKSEMAVGQCTTYGDMAGALAPIADLFKTRIYELARYINSRKMAIPETVLKKAPSAELAPGQTDEAKFGPFAVLDQVLEMYIEKRMSEEEIIAAGFDAAYVRKTIAIVRNNEFKRKQSALVLKVSSKAFGSGRRIPVAGYLRPVVDSIKP